MEEKTDFTGPLHCIGKYCASTKDISTAAITAFGTIDVMHFSGHKPHGNFAGEIIIDSKKHPQDTRNKFRMKSNTIKLYDHLNVLRIGTTLNNSAEFNILISHLKMTRVKQSANGRPCAKRCPTSGVIHMLVMVPITACLMLWPMRILKAQRSKPLIAYAVEAKRRIHRASRLIAKLRGHRLINKVQNSRLHRVVLSSSLSDL